ncbi:MAG TPA: flagellar biosynthesis protein FlhB [Anaerohalosphaeraceae bacterium]|nr:flagellar biosynthesis protein FlhB [Anaerohalosphaeraceae bacterium]
MSEANNKTEKPTPRRISKARKQGHTPQSQEMLSAITLLTLILVAAFSGPWFLRWCKNQIRMGSSCQHSFLDNSEAFVNYANSLILEMLLILTPYLVALTAAGVIGSILISGRNFAPNALKWKLDALNPLRGAQSLFSMESLLKLGLSVLKLAFIGGIVWKYLHDKIDTLAVLQWIGPDQLLGTIARLIFNVVIRICLGLLILGIIDVFYQRWRYTEKLKMSKQEIKYEFRDTEGPPELKVKIRQKQLEAATRRMLKEVPRANVVLVNPDHVAVALRYDPAEMNTPVLIAKGAGHLCEKIKEIARAYGVPILRRPPLARELYATVKLGKPIPEKLYTAVAEILALIYRLRHTR